MDTKFKIKYNLFVIKAIFTAIDKKHNNILPSGNFIDVVAKKNIYTQKEKIL